MLVEATKVWRKMHFRNLPSLKKLPMVGGSDHEGSLYHSVTKTDIGVQVEFPDDLQASRSAQEDSEVSVETKLDAQVQVVAQAVASNADLCHDTLDVMDMRDVGSGVEQNGNRAAGRNFSVDEKCVQRWRSQKENLMKMPRS